MQFQNQYNLPNEFSLSSTDEAFINRYKNIEWSLQLLHLEPGGIESSRLALNKTFESIHTLVSWTGIPFTVQVTPSERLSFLPISEIDFWNPLNKALKQVTGCRLRAVETGCSSDDAVKRLFYGKNLKTRSDIFLHRTNQIRQHISLFRNRLLCDDELNLILNYISRRGLDKLPEIARVKLEWHSRNMKVD